MDKKNYPNPTEAELEILQIIWQHDSCTVKTVNEAVQAKREVGYTTTLKLMQIMHEKGLLLRDDSSRTHIYSANASVDKTRGQLLDNFVNNAFQGSAMQLVLQALGSHDATQQELDEIKELIKKIEENPN
jgi:BlaI family transcriptional regulator, penicillinase repressor